MIEARPSPVFVASGNFFFRYRNYLFPTMFVAVFLASPPDALFAGHRTRQIAWIAGAALVVLGQAFRLAVIGFAYIKRGGKEGKVFAEKLVVRGFYAHTRNPMYVGNGLIVIGLCLAYQSPFSLYAALPFFLFAYYSITVAEETYLRRQFGADYQHYERTVNRFIPDFRGLSKSLAEFRYDWKRAIRKDYGNVTQAALLLILIRLRSNAEDAFRTTSPYTPALVAGAVLALAFYLGARWLKKTGRLASSN